MNNPSQNKHFKLSTTPILSCQQLSADFAHIDLFSNLSFNLKEAECLSVFGENGSGKTTLLKILAGLLRPKEGKVFCCDEEIWPKRKATHEHGSFYLSYTPAFYLAQSVNNNFNFYLKCYGLKESEENIHNALHKVNLFHKRKEPAGSLSTGQKRRLTLAILMLLKPRLVLADEPTNGLDSEGTQLCFDIFEELRKNAKTSFVVATHESAFKNFSQECISLHNFKPQKIQHAQKCMVKDLL